MTTHYTEEADYLCKRILIIDFGKIVELDTPDNLKARLQGDVVSLLLKKPADTEILRPILEKQEWIHKINVVASGNNYAAMSRMMQTMQHTPQVNMDNAMPEMSAPSEETDKTQFDSQTRSKCLNLLVDNGGHRIPEIVKLAEDATVVLESVELRKPTLDDVFLSVTGRNIREEEGNMIDMIRQHRIVQQARGRHVSE